MSKMYVGPKLRQLRREHGHSQSQMAKNLGVSAAYVNLLESNQRSLSAQVLVALVDHYNVDTKSFTQNNEAERLSDLRSMTKDPIFQGDALDLAELRGALDHAPGLVDRFESLYRDYQKLADHAQSRVNAKGPEGGSESLPETDIYEFFQSHSNHFPELERAAERIRDRIEATQDELYGALKRDLRITHGVQCDVRRLSDMEGILRNYDAEQKQVHLSEALDQANRNFQLAHVLAQIEISETVATFLETAKRKTGENTGRLRAELLNYAAAAILMPYDPFLEVARKTLYDVDRLSSAFGVTFEQACHRLTTLQARGAQSVPFFLLRVDRAGNVTKRYNASKGMLAEYGGGCPVWNIYAAFQTPSIIIPQFVELWDGKRFFTIARTSDRPVFSRDTQDRRVVIALGCDAEFADAITYARRFNTSDSSIFAPIGINCHTCPRQGCTQRAHQPIHVQLKFDSSRRGATRYES